jgi:hypothetical protein
MSHNYYEGDTEDRKRYFDRRLSNSLTYEEKASIKDYSSFINALTSAFGSDNSLSYYVANMSEEAKIEFFKREIVQNWIRGNLSKDETQDMFGREWSTNSVIANIQSPKEKKTEIKSQIDLQQSQFKKVKSSRIRYIPEKTVYPKGKYAFPKIIPAHFNILWSNEEKKYLRGLKKLDRAERNAKFQQKYSYHSAGAIDSQYDRTFKRQRQREKRKR